MRQLSDQIHARVKTLCAEGDELAGACQYPKALDSYWGAWDLLPPPATQWEAATWILAAVLDANYLGGDYEAGRDNGRMALRCPGGLGNPFIHLRLGQCCFELGDREHAADELARAYLGAGRDIFTEERPEHFAFLQTRLKEPEGGW